VARQRNAAGANRDLTGRAYIDPVSFDVKGDPPRIFHSQVTYPLTSEQFRTLERTSNWGLALAGIVFGFSAQQLLPVIADLLLGTQTVARMSLKERLVLLIPPLAGGVFLVLGFLLPTERKRLRDAIRVYFRRNAGTLTDADRRDA